MIESSTKLIDEKVEEYFQNHEGLRGKTRGCWSLI